MVTEYATSADPMCTYTTDYSLTVVQDGSSVWVEDLKRSFTATICGNQVTADVPFSYPDTGGQSTVTQLSFVVNGNQLQGNSTWTWTDGVQSCSGTSTFTATRQ